MTDERPDDRAARVAALMARWRASASAKPAASAAAPESPAPEVALAPAPDKPVAPRARRSRRRHAAAGGRILVAGVSISAALVLTTAMARSEPQDDAASAPDVAAPVQPAPIVVRIVVAASPAAVATPSATAAPSPVVTAAPSPVAPTVPAPVATAAPTTRSRVS